MIERSPENPERLRFRWLWLALGWLLVAAIIGLSLMPSPLDPGIEYGDKFEHVLAYGLLMFWFCQLYVRNRARIGLATVLCAVGIALEFAQGATGYRTYDEFDMLANALGVAAGWAVARASGAQVFARIERLIGA